MLTTRLLGVTIMIGLALAIAGVARSPASPSGRLVVGEHRTHSDLIYPEGYISFLRVRDARGQVVARRRDAGKIHLRARLPAGDYRVVRFVRPCDGNCGYLDPPTERCRTDFTIDDGGKTRAIILSRAGYPCQIAVRSGA